MGLFKKRATDPTEIEHLKAEIASMAARLDATDADKQQLGHQVQGIVQRLDAPLEPPLPPPAPEPTVHPDAFRAVIDRVQSLADRLDAEPAPTAPSVHPDELAEVRHRVGELADRLDQVDGRITSISTELANQISELSGDLEGLQGGGDISQLADEMHDAQVKLANEQARYQIAFRQDLAELADFLKRS